MKSEPAIVDPASARQGLTVEGTLTRYNRKSVSVNGADGQNWNIAPGFLRKADQAAASKTPNIIALPKR
jgi:hypothetical protein